MTANTTSDSKEFDGAPRGSRVRATCRFVLSIALALVACLAVWQFVPSTLSLSTSVVGTPTFLNFDYHRYFDAFYLAALVFPILTLLLYSLQVRVGPLAERERPAERLLPLRATDDSSALAVPQGSLLGTLCRLCVPALVVAMEVSAGSVSSRRLSLTGLLAAGLYLLGVLVVASVPWARLRPGWGARGAERFPDRLSVANALAMVVVVPLALFVSGATSVSVASPAHVVTYTWLPAWLAAVFAVAVLLYVIRGLRRSGGSVDLRNLEGTVLVVVVGTLFVYLCVAGIPGALGSFGGFDDAQYLAAAQLVFTHGLLPWRDIYLLHGMIEDVFAGVIGFGVFAHSRWGALAGQSAIVYPVIFCVYYLFVAYFARRARMAIALVALLIVAGETTAVMRFALLPLTLVALDRVLREPSHRRCAVLAGVVLLEAICTPEIALMAVGILAVTVAHDLARRDADESWWSALCTSRRTFGYGAALSAIWVVYLVSTGSLGAFVDYYRVFGSDHALWGALPLQWSLTGDPRTTTELVLPVVLLLATVWRFVERARRRSAFSARDWTMLAAASFVLLYFQKGLDRPDSGHIAEVFTVAMPLVLLWGLEALETLDEWWHDRISSRIHARGARWGWVSRQGAVSVIALGLVIVLVPNALDVVKAAPANFHATAPTDPVLPLLGYENPGAVNLQEIETLGKIIVAYTPPNGPVFDFDNEPGIVYFLLNRVPGSRFFHVEEAETVHAQQEVIAELASAKPNLVIFTASDFGLPTVDGIIGPVRNYLVSQYILDHYSPFAEDNGQLVMIRDDLSSKVAPVSSLHLPGVVKGFRGLYFTSFSCDWGYVPNFLAPQAVSASVEVPLSGEPINTEITGWAVDDRVHGPVRTVIAVSDRKVIASTHPDIYRLDIQDFFEKQAGWTSQQAASVRNSGFVLTLHVLPKQPIQVYAVNADGSVTRIIPTPPPAPRLDHGLAGGAVRKVTFGGVTRPVERGSWLAGWLNASQSVNERVYTLRLPPGINLAPFQSMQVSSSGLIGSAAFTLGDIPYDGDHSITFESLPSAGSHLVVPVGSCLSWHGYAGPLELVEEGGSPLTAVTIRQ